MTEYRWNPLWRAPESPDNAAYLATIKRMIMASVNWFAAHPGAEPKWQEADWRKLARAAGVPDDTPIEDVAFIGNWERFYRPTDDLSQSWFDAIVAGARALRGEEDDASARMFGKAIAAGVMFSHEGWEGFNATMLQRDEDEKPQ